jgi:hypothetical protein
MTKIFLHRILILFFLAPFSYISLAQREIKPCQQLPAFITKFGIDPLWSALSTSEKRQMGLVLVELIKTGSESKPSISSFKGQIFQDSSWKMAGWLSSIALDASGNVYCIPAPLVSVLYNLPKNQNTIHRVDANSGTMAAWLKLPMKKYEAGNSPYGLMGICYDCSSGILFASTIAGSKRFSEKGLIYSIKTDSKKIIDSLPATDAIGLTLFFDPIGKKRLLFGKARTGEIWSVLMKNNGHFDKSGLKKELSLESLGPRGDDKARKIRFSNNLLTVNGIAFNYNLQASSEKPETTYEFQWSTKNKTWQLVNLY